MSGESDNELLQALKKVLNNMISNVDEEMTRRRKAEESLRESEDVATQFHTKIHDGGTQWP